MTQSVNITLSESTYRRLQRWAESRQKNLDEAITDILNDALLPINERNVPPSEPDPQVDREQAAYLQLFPQLKENYAGQYVAIQGGRLVDHDENFDVLFERIDDQYPDTFVWMSQVENEPMRTIEFRSPRFVEGAT